MAAVRHLELLFGYPGPPTKFYCWPEACVQISCRSDLYLRRYVRSNISRVWLKMPICAPQNLRFRGILTPKHYFSSSRPPKGTSLVENTCYEPTRVEIGPAVWPGRGAKNTKQEAWSSSANRAKPCKFVYALFRDYSHTRASRLLESETRSQ